MHEPGPEKSLLHEKLFENNEVVKKEKTRKSTWAHFHVFLAFLIVSCVVISPCVWIVMYFCLCICIVRWCVLARCLLCVVAPCLHPGRFRQTTTRGLGARTRAPRPRHHYPAGQPRTNKTATSCMASRWAGLAKYTWSTEPHIWWCSTLTMQV